MSARDTTPLTASVQGVQQTEKVAADFFRVTAQLHPRCQLVLPHLSSSPPTRPRSETAAHAGHMPQVNQLY